MHTSHKRIFPKAVSAELRRLPWRLFGLSLLGVTIGCWLALMSWSYVDPSLNYATDTPARNWLGARGATLADALMQAFGLSAPLLFLPLAALGLQIMQGIAPMRMSARFACWLLAAAILPLFFSFFPVTSGWPLSYGLGGLTGDYISGFALQYFAGFAVFVKPVFLLLSSVFGLWFLLQACGVQWNEFLQIFKRSTHHEGEGFDVSPSLGPGNAHVPHRFTQWAGRLSLRNRALIAAKAPAKEFWMTAASSRATPEPVAQSSQQTKLPVEIEKPQAATPSPFANWGKPFSSSSARDGFISSHSEKSQDKAEDSLHDDVRIEPFFGPRPIDDTDPFRENQNEPDTFAPVKHLASHKAAPEINLFHTTPAFHAFTSSQISAIPFRQQDNPKSYVHRGEQIATNGHLPPLDLLAAASRTVMRPGKDDPHLVQRAAMLMDVLADFGVKGRISGVYPGPVITLFELEPARGTKSSRVVGLADDIARSMSAVSARVAVVPGRDAIGIELPNATREIVSLRAMIEAPAFQSSQAALPLALGKSIGGEPIVVDLARMPHLLIAGTTGSGKSVGINTMILSLLYRLTPSQCNFIMIDPKMLELSVYDGIPHLLSPVVTDPKKAVSALKWTVKEMNERYELMCKLGVRNITNYNAKVAAAQLRGQPLRRSVQTGFDPASGDPLEEEETFEPVAMPYIVVVIDEMADLMMVAGKEIEYAVQRLSQMARAAGIHLIMATQRPSVDVVTGTIKANFPSRISFQVTSKIDSRTIIGEQGAEQLLGAGDMLYMAAGGRIIRAHGPFVSDEDVETVARYLKTTGFPSYRDDILEDPSEIDSDIPVKNRESQNADLYDQAVQIVLKDKKPTTSYLQRRLGIGYNRAASLIERMEEEGIIGAPSRTGRREILVELQ